MKNTNRKVEQREQAGIWVLILNFCLCFILSFSKSSDKSGTLNQNVFKRKRKFIFQKKRTQL